MSKREKVQKTNAMRELDRAGISYEVREFEETDVSRGVGMRIAEQLGEDTGLLAQDARVRGALGGPRGLLHTGGV